ncbi:hypothetical protein CMUS01_05727 [Colletotrichum musicola]|uniref:Uncharacterized protein n=1 Tax=Colletotrichum musicola TaxID=2175873 RepID=A0A8H6NJV3_9PEZI|nr:hypothetical protein CMUS01_05727 [Colletotrichum musicola]
MQPDDRKVAEVVCPISWLVEECLYYSEKPRAYEAVIEEHIAVSGFLHMCTTATFSSLFLNKFELPSGKDIRISYDSSIDGKRQGATIEEQGHPIDRHPSIFALTQTGCPSSAMSRCHVREKVSFYFVGWNTILELGSNLRRGLLEEPFLPEGMETAGNGRRRTDCSVESVHAISSGIVNNFPVQTKRGVRFVKFEKWKPTPFRARAHARSEAAAAAAAASSKPRCL